MANLFIRSRNSLPGGNDELMTNEKAYATKEGRPTQWLVNMDTTALKAQYGPIFWVQLAYRGVPIGILEQITNPAVLTWGEYIPSREMIFHHGEVLRMDVMYPSASGGTMVGEAQIVVVEREGGSISHKLQMSEFQKQLRGLTLDNTVKDQTYSYLSQTYGDGGMNPYTPTSISTNDRVNEVLFRYQNGKPNHTIAVNIVPSEFEVNQYFQRMESENGVLYSFCINAKTGGLYGVIGYDTIFGKFVWGERQDMTLLRLFPIGALLTNGNDTYELTADGELIKKN